MAQYIAIPRRCGIYYLPPYNPNKNLTEEWIPLTQVTANARISHYSANVVLSQTFIPPYSDTPDAKTPEAKYSFPVYPLSSVVSFVARIKLNGSVVKTIKGLVKSLPTAKKEYKEAVARGETAGFLEQVEEDVFTMRLGNIPTLKGTEVEVDVGYVTELKHDSEVDGIRFTVPTAIAPRYGKSSTGVGSTSGTHVRNGLEVNVEVDMPGPVTSVQSPSHPLAVSVGTLNASGYLGGELDNKLAFAKLSQPNTVLEKDFVLLIFCKDSAAPKALLETHTDVKGAVTSAALMLTFVPKFVIPPAPGPKKVRKEIIFMVDRSGSMYDKIDPLKSALRVFLKSLPPNDGIRFDICSFGSRYSFLFDQRNGKGSRLYSQESLKKALDHVEEIAADYGGTEILEPLSEACERVLRRNKQRTEKLAAGNAEEEDKAEWETEVLLLTDGEVWDTEPLFNLVRRHTHEWRAKGKRADGRAGIRVFTLGIGKDVSHGFVEGLAKAGGGYCMTVGDNERFEGKVVRMLKAALGERVGGYKLTFDGIEEWGASSPATSRKVTPDGDDDFEIVDSPKASSGAQTTSPAPEPAPAPAPISLFDISANPDSEVQTAKPAPAPTLIPPVLIRAPHIIPPLFSFTRTTVFLVLSPRTADTSLPLPQNVMLRAVTSGGQPLELSIPVTKISVPGSKTLHQLATKRYLDDLKAGESWIHSACGSGEQLECIYGEGETAKTGTVSLPSQTNDDFNEDEFNDIIKHEGERIGVQWGVVGKWTAFVALEEDSAGQKTVEDAATPQPPPPPPPQQSLFASYSYAPMGLNARGGSMKYQAISQPAVSSAQMLMGASTGAFGGSRGGPPLYAMSAITESARAVSPPPSLYGMRTLCAGAVPPPPSIRSMSARRGFAGAAPPPPPAPNVQGPSQLGYQSVYDEPEEEQEEEHDGDEEMGFALLDDSAFTSAAGSISRDKDRHRNRDREQTKAKSSRTPPRSDADAAGRLIDLQDFEGYWTLTNEILDTFWSQSEKVDVGKLTIANLSQIAERELPVSGSVDALLREKILATCLALVWFRERLAGEKDTWELVVDKGSDWLTANAGEGYVDACLAFAKNILGIAIA